jgi:hypothetical protein
VLSLLKFLIEALRPKSPISLAVAPSTDVNSISTLKITSPSPRVLRVQRNQILGEGTFGQISLDGEFICYSMEKTAVEIPVGEYPARIRYSPHFAMNVPGIDVPNRTDIEIHPANYPSELKGCIATGSTVSNGALDNSRAAFQRLVTALPDSFKVIVS